MREGMPHYEHQPSTPDEPEAERSLDGMLHRYADESDELRVEDLSPEKIEEIERAFAESTEIQRYLGGPITIDCIMETPDVLHRLAADAGIHRKTATALVNRSQELASDIRLLCGRYGGLVRQFNRSKIARFHIGHAKLVDDLGEVDKSRRTAHETLLDAMRIYNRFLSWEVYKNHGLSVPKEYFIPESFLRNREGSRKISTTWALTTDYYLRAKSLIESARAAHEQKKMG